MKTSKSADFTIVITPEILIAFIINLIVFSANNKLMVYTKHLSFLVLILCMGVFLTKNNHKIKINRFKGMYFAFVFFIMISCIWNKSANVALDYSVYFVSGICIIFTNFSKAFYEYLIKFFKAFFWIFIFSMFLEGLLPDVFHMIFGFASFGDEEMRAITSGGAIAGLAFEKAYAAFICNLGLGVISAEFIMQKSRKYIIQSILVMIALMMTGKRTLFIIPIVILLIDTIVFAKNHKLIKIAGIGLGVSAVVIVAYTTIPAASLIIDRMIDNGGDLFSGRETFWKYAMDMFRQNPLMGNGFLSFNDYAFAQGFRYYGERWDYQAHNIYVQLLGETGIIGGTLIITLIISMIHQAISRAKQAPNFWNVLLIYWSVLFGIYSLTGNTLYYPCQLMILILEILLMTNMNEIRNVDDKVRKSLKWRL